MEIKNKLYQRNYNSRKSLDYLELNMRTGESRKKELKRRAHNGSSAILEMKIIEIEKAVTEKNKNLEIHKLTIPYLHLQKTLEQYLSKKEINKFDLRYHNAIKEYWGIKK